MNTEKSFQEFYQTLGIRTPAPKGEHWHEAYQRLAFTEGVRYGMEYCKILCDKIADEIEAVKIEPKQ